MSDSEQYFANARSWAEGHSSVVAHETRIAWRVAIGAGVIALILAITLLLLVPLKTVEPYVLTVDRQTGAVEPVNSVRQGSLTQNEAVIQAQLAGYVMARETFDASDLPLQYHRVQILSAPPVARAYVAQMAAANPESPLRTLGQGDILSVRIRSVSLIGDNSGLVRFTTTRKPAGAATGQDVNYVGAISFGFSGRPLRTVDRYDNPLGFQVVRYRRDAEGIGG
ncbi:MAG: VirB8/TrbF family protein [Sphingomicrobium sp.]